MTSRIIRTLWLPALTAGALALSVAPARALDRPCDPADEDCRAILIDLIRNERAGIDVAFWFMEDARFSNEIVRRFQAGVPVRVLVDTRANNSNTHNAYRLAELQAAGIPMRRRTASGILHYKMMLFSGQNTVQFSGANYSADAFVYTSPYAHYVDEIIYFTDDPSVVNSFRTKFDDLWIDTSSYANYANINGPLLREYGVHQKDPELNFPPLESYANRSVRAYRQESMRIDVTMYRITDRRHTDAIIAARQRGIPVRLITEPMQYRDTTRLWHSWNVDRLYMAGVYIRHRAHAGLNHQKSVLLYSQQLAIFGSSNWTSPSDRSQEEHNYFTSKPHLFQWLREQFGRKWNNSTGVIETTAFTPLPPDAPRSPSPAHGTGSVPTTATLEWWGGPWAHKYDVYLGTTTSPGLVARDLALGPSANSSQLQQFAVPYALSPGTTYYWRIVGKTMANRTASSPLWSFTTSGSSGSPPPGGAAGPGDIVLYASAASGAGLWAIVSDSTAAGGRRLWNPNYGRAKITTASASPANWVELTFNAQAGTPYRLWMRMKAEGNHYANDSVFVQFSGSVTSSGAPTWRIGTASATAIALEDCSGCGVSNWGWQDNGWGAGVLGPLVYFATTGTHRIRIQQREDGVSIDQIVLSPALYRSSAPGALKNDTTIMAR